MGIYAITGASSGIGAAIGRQLKAQGHYVINISRRAAAEDAADVNISADLAMKAERGRVLEALYAAAPDGLDGFVSCSGVGPTQPADVIVSINYFAAREMTEGAYPLVEKKKGVILVVSSNSATLPQLNTELVDIMLNQNDEDAAVAYGKTLEGPAKYQAYQASKNAIARWVRRWSGSWAARGVRMNTIAPGATHVKKIIDGAHAAGVKVIASNHDFFKTPAKADIIYRLRKMQDMNADIPKIAVMPQNRKDVLTLLAATEEMATNYADRPIITMSMAGTGVISRLCGEVFGSSMTFGAAKKASAPGQMGVNDLSTVLDLLHKAM